MNIVLPQTDGWSAMTLVDDARGKSGIVVKREYMHDGGVAVASDSPVGIITADTFDAAADPPNIVVEGETALFKTQTDWHFLGYPPASVIAKENITSATLKVEEIEHVTFTKGIGDPFFDPDNLFGFEPRETRVGLSGIPGLNKVTLKNKVDTRMAENAINGIEMDRAEVSEIILFEDFGYQFDYDDNIPKVFHSSRDSGNYEALGKDQPVPAQMNIEVAAGDLSGSDTILSLSLTIPTLNVTAFVYEGGPDDAAYWCKRVPVALVADTVTLSMTTTSVLWRAAFDNATHPLGDLRQLTIAEVSS